VAIRALFIGGGGSSALIFGLEAAAGQTITRTTDEANLFIHIFMIALLQENKTRKREVQRTL
jgi:hypothetical protein